MFISLSNCHPAETCTFLLSLEKYWTCGTSIWSTEHQVIGVDPTHPRCEGAKSSLNTNKGKFLFLFYYVQLVLQNTWIWYWCLWKAPTSYCFIMSGTCIKSSDMTSKSCTYCQLSNASLTFLHFSYPCDLFIWEIKSIEKQQATKLMIWCVSWKPVSISKVWHYGMMKYNKSETLSCLSCLFDSPYNKHNIRKGRRE